MCFVLKEANTEAVSYQYPSALILIVLCFVREATTEFVSRQYTSTLMLHIATLLAKVFFGWGPTKNKLFCLCFRNLNRPKAAPPKIDFVVSSPKIF